MATFCQILSHCNLQTMKMIMTLITLCSIGAFLGQQFFWLSLTRDYFDISFGDKFWHKSCPNICRLFWLFWKVGIPLIKNHRCGYFLATVGKFGLLLIPTFGHTGSNLHWTHYLLPYLIQAHISTDRQIGEKDAILARFTFGKCQILLRLIQKWPFNNNVCFRETLMNVAPLWA